MKGGLPERGIFKHEVPLSVTLAEFLTSHHRAAHSPAAVLDVQCSGNVPLRNLHCPVINLNNQRHYIGSTVSFMVPPASAKGIARTWWEPAAFSFELLSFVRGVPTSVNFSLLGI